MKKFIFTALAALMTVPASTWGQDLKENLTAASGAASSGSSMQALTASSQQAPRPGREQDLPAVAGRIMKPGNARKMRASAPAKLPETPQNGSRRLPTIWADVMYYSEWGETDWPIGYYSFEPADVAEISLLGQQDFLIGYHGCQIKDGKLYGCYCGDLKAASDSRERHEYISTYDIETWEGTTQQTDTYTMVAVETAQAADGTVYGQFYAPNFSRREWCIVDYPTMTRTSYGVCKRNYVAIGITSDKRLYGIAWDGNLYQIDIESNEEKLIGPTGLTLNGEEGPWSQTGEIDQSDDTFYWAAIDYDGGSGIYTVDLETGHATYVSKFVGQMVGMIIPPVNTHDEAPDAPDNLSTSFSGASYTGTMSFTAPSKTYGGDPLSGSLSYTVTANKKEVASGSCSAGQAVTVPITVNEGSGFYNFAVSVANAEGSSPKKNHKAYVGFAQPQQVENLAISAKGNDVSLSWAQPSWDGVNDGYQGTLKYDVVRADNLSGKQTRVASGLTSTSFNETVRVSELTSCTYLVIAVNGDLEGSPLSSDRVTVGPAITGDYVNNFSSARDFILFSMLDANHDGKAWRWEDSSFARSEYHAEHGNDDWLVTPPLSLGVERVYMLTFKAKNRGRDTQLRNTFEVRMGDECDASKFPVTLVETNEPSNEWREFRCEIMPDKAGTYYVGFHDNTAAADKYSIDIDDVSIAKGALVTSPDSVTSFTVTPAELGVLEAKLSFTIPSKTINGTEISAVDGVIIKRDNETIATLPGMKAGESTVYTDAKVPAPGWHSYQVILTKDNEEGRQAMADIYVGEDIPQTPSKVVLSDGTDHIKASWEQVASEGKRGFYVNPNNVKGNLYKLVQTDSGLTIGDLIAASEPGSLELSFDYNTEYSGSATQGMVYLGARAGNDAGEGDAVATTPLIIGPSISMPFKESFPKGDLANGFAYLEANDAVNSRTDATNWSIDATRSSDGDGYSISWKTIEAGGAIRYVKKGDVCSLGLPKVKMEADSHPYLTFDYYATSGDKSTIEVVIRHQDGSESVVSTIDLSSTETDGWYKAQVDLSEFKNERYILPIFRGTSKSSNTNIGLDNIFIFNQVPDNLAVTRITLPKILTVGTDLTASVDIRNLGSNDASGYTVYLYNGGSLLKSRPVSDVLAPLNVNSVDLDFKIPVNNTNPLNLRGEVVYDKDMVSSDNSLQLEEVQTQKTLYPAIDNLTSVTSDDNASCLLFWGRPEPEEPTLVTDGFEDYDPWLTQFGEWTTYCGDDGYSQTIDLFYPYPLRGKNFAYMTFRPADMISRYGEFLDDYPGYAPHSGLQYAATVYHYSEVKGGYVLPSDNWLISPTLSGNAQEIKFYARNYCERDYAGNPEPWIENFDILYSTTGTDIEDFTLLKSETADGTNIIQIEPNWKEITAYLPEGAHYFAIHHNTAINGSEVFGIDDVTFEKGSYGQFDKIVSFNVYRDGELLTKLDGNAYSFIVPLTDTSSHQYNVTVVFESNTGRCFESPFSNTVTVEVSGIRGIESEAGLSAPFDIYTPTGIMVRENASSLEGLPAGIYIINGRKYIMN